MLFETETTGALQALPVRALAVALATIPFGPAAIARGQSTTPTAEVELQIATQSATLPGLLRTPARDGPVPAVVLLHGSRPAERRDADVLAVGDAFLDAGFAVLTTDKRGVGDSGGDAAARFQRLAEDAAAAVAALRERPEIAGGCIGLWGKSQGGGWVGPLAAASIPDLAFLIGAAAPLETLEAYMLRFLGRRLAEQRALTQAQLAKVAAARSAIWEYMASGTGRDSVVATLNRLLEEGWLPEGALPGEIPSAEELADLPAGTRSFLDDRRFDPLPVIAGLDVPALFVYGSEDDRLPVADYRAALDAAAEHGSQLEVVVLDGVDHDLRSAGATGEAPAAGALETMTRWASRVVGAGSDCGAAVSR